MKLDAAAGRRVRLNERGRRLYCPNCAVVGKRAGEYGTIVRETANRAFWMIRWDGLKREQQTDKRLVEIVA